MSLKAHVLASATTGNAQLPEPVADRFVTAKLTLGSRIEEVTFGRAQTDKGGTAG
jgi:hypothetical protein